MIGFTNTYTGREVRGRASTAFLGSTDSVATDFGLSSVVFVGVGVIGSGIVAGPFVVGVDVVVAGGASVNPI